MTLRQVNNVVSAAVLSLVILASGCAGNDYVQKDSSSSPTDEQASEARANHGDAPPEPISIDNVRIDDFILGVGDTIDIMVYRHEDLKRTVKIDRSGKFMYPLVGDVEVSGKGVFELRDEIQQRLSRYIKSPQVTINVTGVESHKVMVIGEVKNPGILTLDSSLDVIESIMRTGGATDDAKLETVLLIRRHQGETQVTSLDLKKALEQGDFTQNRQLQNGDIVYVPEVPISDLAYFFGYLSRLIAPIVSLESGIVLWPQVQDAFSGNTTRGGTSLSIPAQ